VSVRIESLKILAVENHHVGTEGHAIAALPDRRDQQTDHPGFQTLADMHGHDAYQVFTRAQLGIHLLGDFSLHQSGEGFSHFPQAERRAAFQFLHAPEGVVNPPRRPVEGFG